MKHATTGNRADTAGRLGWLATMACLGVALAGWDVMAATTPELFARTNLMAWCIVPFDAAKRGPEERAAMLERLGIRHFAYDYRAEHIPTFDAEVEALQRHGIALDAWWFPAELNDEARGILGVLQRHGIHAQLWVTGGGEAPADDAARNARIDAEAQRLGRIAGAAAPLGCTVALYNHGGWFGEPENQIAIIERMRGQGLTNVGIVYNLHHGHTHLDRFPELLARMKPYLVALNLNGMTRDGEATGRKILPLGQGDLDLALLRQILASGWRGPIGILNHTDEDAEGRLRDNLDGLDWLVARLGGQAPGSRPVPRTWKEPAVAAGTAPSGLESLAPAYGRALAGGMVVPGRAEYRQRPLTVECWARLRSAQGFNILVACDPKASAEHWELYSYAGSGVLSLYQPGRGGEFKSTVNICDNRWHHVAAIIEPDRVRLFVDAAPVLDTRAPALQGTPMPGDLAFGRLVEGGIGCDGLIDEVRLSRGGRIPTRVPTAPLTGDADTLGHWNFDDLPARAESTLPATAYWAVEDAAARERLPMYQTIPAARPDELTPTGKPYRAEDFGTWTRSHADAAGTRYSGLRQIDRTNVKRLEVAWTYHSGDGKGNIQCNPIIVRDVMYAPTPGDHVVAVDAVTGREKWRFKPAGRPAFRGLIWWPGGEGAGERLFFCAGQHLYALDPANGQLVGSFGEGGRARLPGAAQGSFGAATAAPAIFERILIVPGFEKDVWGFDVLTGVLRWTFHTVPQPGEFGFDTWDRPEAYSANCWGGMALDEARGIAFVTTGSPKPNFIGVGHRGQNLFANCVIALDARTGRRLWHFQEIPHDIWDLDIPAPPNLTSIRRDGRSVDVVAATTKIGNTLLLDRVTGKPVFPFRLRRAPVSTLRGEMTWPYQPDPELPEPFARQDFPEELVTERSEEARDFVMGRFKSATTGWFQPFVEGRPNLFFGLHGGAEWTGACVDPANGRLYVSANHLAWIISVFRDDDPPDDPGAPRTRGREVYEQTCAPCHGTNRVGIGTCPPLRGVRHRLKDADIVAQVRNGKNSMPAHPQLSDADVNALVDYLLLRDRPARPPEPPGERPVYSSNGYPKLLDHEGYPGNKPPWGTLNCIDLNTGRMAWRVPLGEHPELRADGVRDTGTENFGGPIVTAGGLVFCSGTRDGRIRAFDADSGAELWSATLPWVGTAAPATYLAGGRQFVVVPATGGGKLGAPVGDAYVAFALPAK